MAKLMDQPLLKIRFELVKPIDGRIWVMHSQLFARLKSESKYKTTEGGKVGPRSLAHNTLKGREVCWSCGMGLGRVDKLHSLTQACT
jgi:hypothetical protein